VIYVTVPPAATPRMLGHGIRPASPPLGLPVLPRANMTDIIEAVCGVSTDMRVRRYWSMMIHNMQLATRSGAEVSDTLKYFSERLPATFVYAGIDLDHTGPVHRDPRPADRRALHSHPHAGLPDGPLEWQSLIVTLEDGPGACTSTSPETLAHAGQVPCTSAPAG